MLRVVTVNAMREIEAAANEHVLSYDEMMERAGEAAAQQARAMLAGLDAPRITCLIGKGNNGGDGLVAAAYLADADDIEVRLYLLARRNDDSLMQRVQDRGLFIAYAEDDRDGRVLRHMCASADLVVDALFGIGVRLPLRDDAAKVLRGARAGIHERRASIPETRIIDPVAPRSVTGRGLPHVLAIDCPSGLDCDTGELDPHSLHADVTITFIAAKHGQLTFPSAAAVGRLLVARIGIPDDLPALQAESVTLGDADVVRSLLPERPADSNKGTFGKAMIAAGSVNYSGAPALAAEAAYRAGAGLVTVAAPAAVVAATAAKLTEPTYVLLPHNLGVIAEAAADVLTRELDGYRALLVGPGMGQDDTTAAFFNTLLNRPQQTGNAALRRQIGFNASHPAESPSPQEEQDKTLPPLVLDADALNLLTKREAWWEHLPPETILTPHPGEMGRLASMETADVQANRIALAREKAAAWQVVLVLKGAHTLIAAPDGRMTVMPFKSDALATAGTGDVLAGVITGLRAQGINAYAAAVAGAYIHGLAGELAAQHVESSRSVTAGDVIAALGGAFKHVEQL